MGVIRKEPQGMVWERNLRVAYVWARNKRAGVGKNPKRRPDVFQLR